MQIETIIKPTPPAIRDSSRPFIVGLFVKEKLIVGVEYAHSYDNAYEKAENGAGNVLLKDAFDVYRSRKENIVTTPRPAFATFFVVKTYFGTEMLSSISFCKDEAEAVRLNTERVNRLLAASDAELARFSEVPKNLFLAKATVKF